MTDKSQALKYCANWNVGKCLGVLFIKGEDSGQLYQRIHEDYEGKECFVDTKKGCTYFKNCVRPIIG